MKTEYRHEKSRSIAFARQDRAAGITTAWVLGGSFFLFFLAARRWDTSTKPPVSAVLYHEVFVLATSFLAA